MNFKSVDIGLLHDLLGDDIQSVTAQRAGREPLDMSIPKDEVSPLNVILADLDGTGIRPDLEVDGLAFVVDENRFDGDERPPGWLCR